MTDVTTAPLTSPDVRKRVLVGTGLGHALEWYDWGIYAIFVPFFATQFFDQGDELSAMLSGLAVFAAGFVARPAGGLLFGWLADRAGRRLTMSLTVGGIAAGSLVIGIAPTYAAIGAWASLILLLARVVQGLACGGELPSAQTYLSESAPAERRGQWSSLIYIASVFGNTMGVLLGLILSLTLTPQQMSDFGWRIPFLLGGLLGVVAFYMRRTMVESETYTTHQREQSERPDLWRDIMRHRKQALRVVGLSVGFTVVYYAWVVSAPAYAISSLGIPSSAALLASVCASVLFMAVMPLWGRWSDRVGRKPVLLVSTVGTAVLLFPLQAFVRDSAWQLGLAMAAAMIFIGAGVAILPAVYAEMFPTRIRTLGLAVPYSVAVALFGGTAPYLQTWIGEHLGRSVFTAYVVLMLLVSAVAALTLPETRAKDLS
ncbi:MHS family alpha-ketoglutarate permease-like MFS transporter [Thermocatellispora tengchongensis]|uniref:MHS family alpha-ketoglutarate permease-like MFS transporter n=1 Tax=Thermocatellispora tengchongensis TaxID=1073253 RepID=A0A840PDW0_9ACTN|nr:MFS transporter [Thermocatellispora tengchongensis]MBB5136123.1 MHS family alpha-ketoglutarate permease-like MFS transporter [Thermocatellispora tengchongensis]